MEVADVTEPSRSGEVQEQGCTSRHPAQILPAQSNSLITLVCFVLIFFLMREISSKAKHNQKNQNQTPSMAKVWKTPVQGRTLGRVECAQP